MFYYHVILIPLLFGKVGVSLGVARKYLTNRIYLVNEKEIDRLNERTNNKKRLYLTRLILIYFFFSSPKYTHIEKNIT